MKNILRSLTVAVLLLAIAICVMLTGCSPKATATSQDQFLRVGGNADQVTPESVAPQPPVKIERQRTIGYYMRRRKLRLIARDKRMKRGVTAVTVDPAKAAKKARRNTQAAGSAIIPVMPVKY